MLTDRLNRQSLQEKRIVTQLMQVRKEKDNIRENRYSIIIIIIIIKLKKLK